MAAPKTPSRRAGLQGPPDINFQRGINTFQKNRMLLQDGEAATLLNADFENFGELKIAKPNLVLDTGLGDRVHSIYCTGDNLFVGAGVNLYHYDKTTMTRQTIYSLFNGNDLAMIAYENFLYVTDGEAKVKFYLPTMSPSTWGIENPQDAPTAILGGTGVTEGTYRLFYTYVAKYLDGTEYETDLSPEGHIVTSLQAIKWTLPAVAPDSQITHLRLYRDKTGLTASLDDARKAIESRQVSLEQTAGVLKYGNLFQDMIRAQTNKKIASNMSLPPDVIVGPFFVGEVDIGSVSYDDNLSDDDLVLCAPFLRERYRPIFGA
jgi:hypothetical protein